MKQFIKFEKDGEKHFVNLANVTEIISNEKIGLVFIKFMNGENKQIVFDNLADFHWFINELDN